MKKIQYFDILKKSLMITLKNKLLWLFGFLVFLGSFPSSFNWIADEKNKDQFNNATNFIQTHTEIFLFILVLFFVLWIVFLILYFIGNAGLIKAANNIAVYGQGTFTSIFKEAKKYILQLFLTWFLVGISLLSIAIILITPALYLLAIREKIFAIISVAVAFMIFVPLIIIAYYLRKFSSFYVVLGNTKALMALEAAYMVFRKNIKESLVMGGIQIILNIIMTAIVFICIMMLALIFMPFGIIAYLMFAKIGIIIIFTIAIFTAILFLLVLFSWYISFIQTMWVLFFQQIALKEKTERETVEKLETTVVPSPEVV